MTAGSDGPAAAGSDLEQVWRSLPAPAGQTLEAQRLGDWPGGPVLAAVDAARTRHLLIGLPGPTPVRPPRPTRGLRIDVRQLRIRQADERTWLDLICPEPGLHRLFASLTEEVLQALSTATSGDPGVVITVAERWRRFWSVSPDGLSRDAQLGLLGELWLLTRWLPRLTVDAIRAWVGPLGGRHDFACAETSVEVKTSGASTGPTAHRIQSLDQLADPVSGTLYLLSLRFTADPLGQVSLDRLIDEARQSVAADDVLADELDQRLAAVSWSPADRGRYEIRWRVGRQALYEVRADFPRLTPDSFPQGLPPGITDVGYTLDIAACGQWLVEDQPGVQSRISGLAHR